MSGNQFYVEPGIAEGLPYLLPCTACFKHGKGRGERDFTGQRQAACCTDHVLFRNTHIKKSVWKSLCEFSCFCRTRQVSVKHDNVFIAPAQFKKRRPVSIPRGNRLCAEVAAL